MIDQVETFEWLRQRSNRLDEVEAELEEVRAKLIKCQLERARLAVRPSVDQERNGEDVGDLMGLRLR